MAQFKKDFELRRNIFGLSAIIKTPNLPAMVQEKIPQIVNQLTILSEKVHAERIDVLQDNEKHLKDEGDDDSDNSDDDIGDENEDVAADGFEDAEDSEEEFKKSQKALEKLGSKLHQGKKLTQDEMDEFALDGYDDEDDDDYEYNGGENALYESKIDNFDELIILRDTLTAISQQS